MAKAGTSVDVLRAEASIRKAVTGGINDALPTTRELAQRHGVSNVTVHRLFRKLVAENLLWRSDNGRYYPARARLALDKPFPLVCLVRRMESWIASYREIMTGFSRACAESRRHLLLAHQPGLVRQADTSAPPVFASLKEQRAEFEAFWGSLETRPHGCLLDHLWKDEALAGLQRHTTNAVMVWRPHALGEVSSVRPDFTLGATLAVGHLLGRGYRHILPVLPFQGDPAVDALMNAFLQACRSMGVSHEPAALSAADAEARRHIVDRVRALRQRVALFCPEDNVSNLLLDALHAARVHCPEKAGVFSGMGTSVAAARGLSRLELPFEAMGFEAGRLLDLQTIRTVVLPVRLVQGGTT